MSLGIVFDLAKELHEAFFPSVQSRIVKTRSEFLNDYSKDIENMTRSLMKSCSLQIDIQDIIQDIKLRILSCKTWHDKKHESKSKVTTYLYVVIRNVIFSKMREYPTKEIPMSHLEENPWKELNEKEYDSQEYDCLEDIRDVQKSVKRKNNSVLNYIFYGYLLGYKNSEIAQKLSVTDMYIGLVWNKFIKEYRRIHCKVVPFFRTHRKHSPVWIA